MLRFARFSTILILLINIYSTSLAQINRGNYESSINENSILKNLNRDASMFINVTYAFFESPFHFDTEDFILTGLIAGGTGFSSTLDRSVRQTVKRNHNPLVDDITFFTEKFGRARYSSALSGIVYVGGHLLGDEYLRETGLMLLEAVLLNGMMTQGLKMIFGRSRPYTNEGNYDFGIFELESENEDLSFPSGHTSTAFRVATVLSERFDYIFVSIALYSLAGLTAYQRIYDDKHWISDTVLGAAIGTVIGLKVVKLHSEINSHPDEATSLNIFPQIDREGYGLGMSLIF